jgi:hypothetical protein
MRSVLLRYGKFIKSVPSKEQNALQTYLLTNNIVANEEHPFTFN